jgi:photosystem II stability/assembly factor-like uncharacterized protein
VVALAMYAVFGRVRGGGSEVAALATLKTADFHALAFAPDNPDVVFFGHHNGIMRSDDAGKTWQALVDRRNFDAMGLGVGRGDTRTVYLAGHDVFQASTDGGKTWQPVQHNLPGTDIHGFAMSPSDPNRLYAYVVGQGTFTSTDGGRTWQRLAGQLPGDVMGLADPGSAGASPGAPETLYASSMGAGVLRSADGGQTWNSAMGALGRRGVLALAADPAAPQTLYAGLEGSGLYKTADGGGTWTRLPFPGQSPVAIAVSPAQPQRVLAIEFHNRAGLVYRSDDGGATWGGRRRACGLLVAVLMGTIAAACAPGSGTGNAAPVQAPRLVFQERTHNFGNVSAAQKREYRFAFRNAGNQSLEISDVQPQPPGAGG